MHCAKFGWYWPSGSGEEDFQISSMYFCYFVIISPWKKVGPFISTNFSPYHSRILRAKFGWNWPSGSGEEDENVKSLRRQWQQWQRQTMDKFWSENLTWAFGSGELKTWNLLSTCISQITNWVEDLTVYSDIFWGHCQGTLTHDAFTLAMSFFKSSILHVS